MHGGNDKKASLSLHSRTLHPVIINRPPFCNLRTLETIAQRMTHISSHRAWQERHEAINWLLRRLLACKRGWKKNLCLCTVRSNLIPDFSLREKNRVLKLHLPPSFSDNFTTNQPTVPSRADQIACHHSPFNSSKKSCVKKQIPRRASMKEKDEYDDVRLHLVCVCG